MDAYETRFNYPLGIELDEGHLDNILKKQRESLLDAMVGKIEPNKKYIVEMRQEYYEDLNGKAGYKAAIFIDEYEE